MNLKIAGFFVCSFVRSFVRSFGVEGRTFSVVNGVFPMNWMTPWKNAAGPA
jgi:hypothetical protein